MTAPTDPLAGLDAADERFAVEAVDRLLAELVRRGGSDLHLVPAEDALTVMIRAGGVLRRLPDVPAGGERIVTRLKVLASLLTYEADRPQEGRLRSEGLDARLATCPTVFGEKAVVRRFAGDDAARTLDDLGLPEDLAAGWRSALRSQAGLLLVAGPAGGGKTTTAYASLRAVLADSAVPRSVVSLEDPVEQVIPGVAQTAVAGNTRLTFAGGLRAALRHDPEVLFVGELRDADTITTALTAALTGHLVLSTLHTGDAAESVVRLFDAGVEPFLILSGLRAVLHQRLARTTDGGRTPVAELLDLSDPAVREAVRRRATAGEIAALVSPDARSRCDALVASGRVSEAERLRLFGV